MKGMPRWLAAILTIVVLGSLGITAGWAWYLRSDIYRRHCAAALAASLDLPADIGRVIPRSVRAREFRDVQVWLPERRGRALTCESAMLTYTPTLADPDGYEIALSGGSCEISTRTWLRRDYRGVIESGLRPGFAPDGPRLVAFGDMNVAFEREGFRVELRQAGGRVEFPSSTSGKATIVCRNINGHECGDSVVLHASFAPDNGGVRVVDLRLDVPRIPLAAARLSDLLGADVTSGAFKGSLAYAEQPDHGRRLILSGQCTELRLGEFSAGLFGTAWSGTCPSIELQELRVVDGQPALLRFRGRIEDVDLQEMLGTFGLAGANGLATLDVGAAELTPDRIKLFVASGRCADISLETLTDALGWGRMTGTLSVRIDDLRIEDDHLVSLDMSLRVHDVAENEPNWIEMRLLRELAKRALHFELPRIPYERIEYTRFGLRMEVRNEELFVFGSHGPREETILTLRFFGADWPIVTEPKRSFDLKPVLDDARARLRSK